MRGIFIFLFLLSGNDGYSQQGSMRISGIWIPEKIDWKKGGDFNTYFFEGNSQVVIISSVQRKIRDSINFNTEEGFNLSKGRVVLHGGSGIIYSKILYRFIKLSGTNYNTIFHDRIKVIDNGSSTRMFINGIPYCKGTKYTTESKDDIIDIATKMVPKIEANPQFSQP